MTPYPPLLDRWHGRVRGRTAARAGLAVAATVGWFAVLVVFNGYHLGADAALHWDTAEAIGTNGRMPTRAELAEARGHVFDLARASGSDDPATVTRYFLSPAGAAGHGPLEAVRRYYSQVAFGLSRWAFDLGGRVSGSPNGGVIAFQLLAAAAVAVGLGLLTAFAVTVTPPGPGLRWRLAIAVLAFAAVATEPVFSSLARQMLTETAGFGFLIPGLMLAVAAARRPWVAGPAAACLFMAVRSRYNLGPAIAALLPLLWLMTVPPADVRRRWPSLAAAALVGCATFAVCVAVDWRAYGPMFMPWVYQDALVRSARLYFHNDPPYDQFWTMAYVNAPLLVLPAAGVACWFGRRVFDRQDRWARAYAAVVMGFVAVGVAGMARQQVVYQPRHLFAFSGLSACVLLATVGRVRWRASTAVPFAALCAFVIGMNVYSTVGPQRTTMRDPWPATIAQRLRQWWATPGRGPSLAAVLGGGYFDWSDNRRVHDEVLVLRRVSHAGGPRPLLVVSGDVELAGYLCRWATQFGVAAVWRSPAGADAAADESIAAALAARRTVFAVTPTTVTADWRPFRLAATDVPLDQGRMWRVGLGR